HARGEIERVSLRVQQVVSGFGIPKGRAKLSTNAERHPNVGCDQRVRPETVLRNPNDRVWLTVDVECATDKIVVAAHSFPKSVTGDDDGNVRVRFALFGVIKAAAKRLRSHQREEIFGGQEGEAAPHLMIAPDPGDRELERGHIGKNVAGVFTQLAI